MKSTVLLSYHAALLHHTANDGVEILRIPRAPADEQTVDIRIGSDDHHRDHRWDYVRGQTPVVHIYDHDFASAKSSFLCRCFVAVSRSEIEVSDLEVTKLVV